MLNNGTVFQLNVCGFRSHQADFQRFIQQHRFAIIAKSESLLRVNNRLLHTVLQSSTGVALSGVLLAVRN